VFTADRPTGVQEERRLSSGDADEAFHVKRLSRTLVPCADVATERCSARTRSAATHGAREEFALWRPVVTGAAAARLEPHAIEIVGEPFGAESFHV
jgi:hypothetical protein